LSGGFIDGVFYPGAACRHEQGGAQERPIESARRSRMAKADTCLFFFNPGETNALNDIPIKVIASI
jgi:hypothetical protein